MGNLPRRSRTAADRGYLKNRPTLCLITDRRRLTTALGWPLAQWDRALLAQLQGAIAGGVDVVQIREPDLDPRVLCDFARDCLALPAASRVRVLVNDRLDVALAAGAGGVHLRETSVGVEHARRLAHSDFVIGRSVHAAASAARARNADYLIAGSVFETSSKSWMTTPLGLGGLRTVVQAAGECPVWAIGGITVERCKDVVATGARGIAAIGAFIPASPIDNLTTATQKVSEVLRFSLDSAVELS